MTRALQQVSYSKRLLANCVIEQHRTYEWLLRGLTEDCSEECKVFRRRRPSDIFAWLIELNRRHNPTLLLLDEAWFEALEKVGQLQTRKSEADTACGVKWRTTRKRTKHSDRARVLWPLAWAAVACEYKARRQKPNARAILHYASSLAQLLPVDDDSCLDCRRALDKILSDYVDASAAEVRGRRNLAARDMAIELLDAYTAMGGAAEFKHKTSWVYEGPFVEFLQRAWSSAPSSVRLKTDRTFVTTARKEWTRTRKYRAAISRTRYRFENPALEPALEDE